MLYSRRVKPVVRQHATRLRRNYARMVGQKNAPCTMACLLDLWTVSCVVYD